MHPKSTEKIQCFMADDWSVDCRASEGKGHQEPARVRLQRLGIQLRSHFHIGFEVHLRRNGQSFMILTECGMVFRQRTMQSVSIWLCGVVVPFLLWKLLSSSDMSAWSISESVHGCKHKHQELPNLVLHKSDTIYRQVQWSIDLRFYARIGLVVVSVEIGWYKRVWLQ